MLVAVMDSVHVILSHCWDSFMRFSFRRYAIEIHQVYQGLVEVYQGRGTRKCYLRGASAGVRNIAGKSEVLDSRSPGFQGNDESEFTFSSFS